MERTCKKCGETKPIEEFSKSKSCLYGYNFTCLLCVRKYSKEYRLNHTEYFKNYSKNYSKGYCQRNSQKIKDYRKTYKLTHKESLRNNQIRRIKNITDSYLIQILKDVFGLNEETLKQYPELMENYRNQIKVKRLIKSKKNESTKTS